MWRVGTEQPKPGAGRNHSAHRSFCSRGSGCRLGRRPLKTNHKKGGRKGKKGGSPGSRRSARTCSPRPPRVGGSPPRTPGYQVKKQAKGKTGRCATTLAAAHFLLLPSVVHRSRFRNCVGTGRLVRGTPARRHRTISSKCARETAYRQWSGCTSAWLSPDHSHSS